MCLVSPVFISLIHLDINSVFYIVVGVIHAMHVDSLIRDLPISISCDSLSHYYK